MAGVEARGLVLVDRQQRVAEAIDDRDPEDRAVLPRNDPKPATQQREEYNSRDEDVKMSLASLSASAVSGARRTRPRGRSTGVAHP